MYVRSTAWFCFVKRLRHLGSTCNPMLSAMRIAAIVFPSRFKHIDSLREKNILGRFGSGWMDFHLLTQHTHFKSFWAKPIDGYSKWHHAGFKFNFDTKGEKRRLTLRPGAPRSPFSPDFPGSPWREEKHVTNIIQVNGDKTSLQCTFETIRLTTDGSQRYNVYPYWCNLPHHWLCWCGCLVQSTQ